MKRRFGFVSNIENEETKLYMKSIRLATIQIRGLEKLIEIYKENIETTSTAIKYCNNNNIKFYRMGNLFPFSTHNILSGFNYLEYFDNDIYELSQLIKFTDTRISLHSSPYCILNSSNKKTLEQSFLEIKHHANFMNIMNLPANNRTVVHVGSSKEGKEKSKNRFINNFNSFDEKIKNRIVLENDDKTFSFKDVEDIYKQTGVPIVLDVFHLRCYNPENIDEIEALERACKTWKSGEIPEIHYSSQDPEKEKGSHANSINIDELFLLLKKVTHLSFDVLIEAKDTHRSVEKIIKELGE